MEWPEDLLSSEHKTENFYALHKSWVLECGFSSVEFDEQSCRVKRKNWEKNWKKDFVVVVIVVVNEVVVTVTVVISLLVTDLIAIVIKKY